MADPSESEPSTLSSAGAAVSSPTNAGHTSLVRLFFLWLLIGVQSFGGGVATLSLIRNAAVDRERWVSGDEFARYWGLVQLAPGINLVALTILLGRRAGGVGGIATALCGLLLPSAAITAALTALYARIQHAEIVERAVRGIIPATVGIGLVTAFQIALPILVRGTSEGRSSVAGYTLLLVCSVLAAIAFRGNVIWILLGAGVLGALLGARTISRDTEGRVS